MKPELLGALVDMTGPDGTVYHFRFAASIPYGGEVFAVLTTLDAGEEEQILITRVEEENGEYLFAAAEEDDVVENVWRKYCEAKIRAAVADLPEADEP